MDHLFPADDPYDGYWAHSGLSFYSTSDNQATELADARAHFYRAVRVRNCFGAEDLVTYDDYDLLGTRNTEFGRKRCNDRGREMIMDKDSRMETIIASSNLV